MKFVNKPIAKNELKEMAGRFAGGLVKAVVDVEKEIMVVDTSMHADEEKELLDRGSAQDNLWGINLYPDSPDADFIEFDSMINIRPRLNNFSRSVEDKDIQAKIVAIVKKLVHE